MYTLRKNIQRLADEPHVREECGPYVTKPGMQACGASSVSTHDSLFCRKGCYRLAPTSTLIFSSETWEDSPRMDGII